MEILFGCTLVLGFCVLLFLALRQVMLWYWKVEVQITNQELTNKLLASNNALLNEQITLMKAQQDKLVQAPEVNV